MVKKKTEPSRPGRNRTNPQPPAPLAQAAALYSQGRYRELSALAQGVLAGDPGNLQFLNIDAVCALKLGMTARAEGSWKQALAIKPDHAETHFNLGCLFKGLQRHDEAEASFRKALSIDPGYAEAHYNLANLLVALNRFGQAEACFRKALAVKPDFAAIHINLANLLNELERFDEAEASYRTALSIKPDSLEAHYNLANLLMAQQRSGEAEACYRQALALKPDFAEAYNRLGNLYKTQQRFEEAEACYGQALAAKPEFAEAHNNLGRLLNTLKRFEAAEASFRRALAVQPDFAEAYRNLGNLLMALQRTDEAEASFHKALAIQPDYAEAHNNLGILLSSVGRFDEALARYEQAQTIRPDYGLAHWNEALCRLLIGDLTRGWPKYEWRWHSECQARNFEPPLWLGGEALAGKTILLHAEQGYGDTLQFCRYAKQLADQGAHVLMEVQPALKSLLAGLDGVSQVFGLGETLPDFDFHCPLLSLPLAFRTQLATIPAKLPYLRADPARVAAWSARLGAKSRPRIGLAWAGNADHGNDRNRSIPLYRLLPLLSPHFQFVCLQKDLRIDDRAVLEGYPEILCFADEIGDFADTAALAQSMDLVISVDTAIAHLAGALARPLWLLLPWVPDWRWLLEREDSPWYPTARLYRQPDTRDWDTVIERVGFDLRQFFGIDHGQPASRPFATGQGHAGQQTSLSNLAAVFYSQERTQELSDLARRVLAGEPHNAEFLNYAAVCAAIGGIAEEAERYWKQAIAAWPDPVDGHNYLGNLLRNLGRFAEAEANYRNALAIQPENAEAHYNLGAVQKALGRLNEAEISYRKALSIAPNHAEAHNDLGNLLADSKRPDEAELSYRKALTITPDYVYAHYNLGNLLYRLQRFDDAEMCFRKALELKPDYAEAHHNLGILLKEIKRLDEAEASFLKALAIDPEDAEAHLNLGGVYLELMRFDQAEASYGRALAAKPDFAEAYNNLGYLFSELMRFDEAESNYRQALAVKPDYAEAHNNFGVLFFRLGRFDLALAGYERAQTIQPDYADAHWNEGVCRLLGGDFTRGWPKYEWRWRTESLGLKQRVFKQPLWLGGKPLAGKTILLHAEQGYGDTLQFCRYVKQLADLGARVLLEVQPALKSLLASLGGVDQVIAAGETLPDFDFHCPLLSLPLAFRTELATIPAKVPYLCADPVRVAAWSARLGLKSRPRIGLAWSGNASHKNDRNRSIPLQRLLPLLFPDFQFICLQKEMRADDQAVLDRYPEILSFAGELEDFADTAALAESMDLVISVDTSVAHLAGALARPLWLLLPYVPDWRWLLEREDSPWYPTARLYRQSDTRDWDKVIERVGFDLRRFFGIDDR